MSLEYDFGHVILKILNKEDIALNSMEICRALNDIDYTNFSICYPSEFSFETKNNRCLSEQNNCDVWSLDVYNRLKKLENKGRVRSLKLKWFDGREGNENIVTDIFRFWFTERKQLGKRLTKDCFEHFNISKEREVV